MECWENAPITPQGLSSSHYLIPFVLQEPILRLLAWKLCPRLWEFKAQTL